MKKCAAFVLAVVCLLSMVGCNEHNPKSKILNAWTGESSEAKIKDTIKEYRKNYSNIVFNDVDEAKSVSFEVDFEVASCRVTRLSRVMDNDINVELNGFIDFRVKTDCSAKKVTIHTDWWLAVDDWTREYPVWSYLVRLEDTSGNIHYYYFRTDYTALAALKGYGTFSSVYSL